MKFYFQHGKRSIRGSKIIAISLMAVLISQILILAFTTQLSGLTSLVKEDDNYLIITPKESNKFDHNIFDQIIEFGQNKPVIVEIFTEYRDQTSIVTNEETFHNIPVHFVDLSLIYADLENINELVYTTPDYTNMLSAELTFQYSNITSEKVNAGTIDPSSPSIDSGLYLDYSSFNVTDRSHIYFQMVNSKYKVEIENILHENYPIETQSRTEEAQFITDSRDNIEKILQTLTVMIAILIVLGISNLVRTILFESRFEIRTLKAIGYSIPRIRGIFYLLAGFMGLIGSILAIIIGIALPNIIFSGLALLSQNIYIPTQVNFAILSQTILIGTLLPVFATVLPVRRYVQ